MQSKSKAGEFARTKLPWITAGVIFALYLLTLNQWVSIRSLGPVSKIAGWDPTLPNQWPLFYTLTFPIRFLPNSIQPILLNLLAALCGAATVWILTRSVALLPHDRTTEQRMRERNEKGLLSGSIAWAPPMLAAAVFGLQLTMWEHSTSATNDALNILIFAYLIRCLLEFRISQNERWLFKLALVYGLGVTNNWALIGYFPLFLGALIWIRGRDFFNLRFVAGMTALGITGMLLYAVIPLLWIFKSGLEVEFWGLLKQMLIEQKVYLFSRDLRARALILSLTSILPVIIMGIRFPAGFGDVSSAGAAVTNVMFRLIHLMFAGVCIWVAFDQQVSPRTLGLGLPFLSFYYLGALAVGYYIGYLMLVATDPPKKVYRPPSPFANVFNPVVQALAWGAIALVPVGLLLKNFKPAQSQNGRLLRSFVEATANQLPNKPAIVLSDDAAQLVMLDGWLARAGTNEHILVHTRGLRMAAYHKRLVERYGSRWPSSAANEDPLVTVDDTSIALSMTALARSNQVFYLHPSFGYFFETMRARPHGWIFQLEPYGTNVIYPPRPSPAEVAEGEKFWSEHETLARRAEALTPLKLTDAMYVGANLSRSLNFWGTQLQRAGKMKEAGEAFELALSLNTNNIPARVNLEFNESQVRGSPRQTLDAAAIEDVFGERYRSWDSILADNGPFDVPEYLYGAGHVFLRQSLYRQATDSFARASELAPTNAVSRMALITSLIGGGWHEEALRVINSVRNSTNSTPSQRLDLISMEAAVQYGRGETNRAERILTDAIQQHPDFTPFFESLNDLYQASRQHDKSLGVLGQMVQRSPTNVILRLRRADLALNMGDTNTASSELAAVERMEPANLEAKLYRAFMAIQVKDYKTALGLVEGVLERDEKNIQALSYKGVIHMEQSENEEAIKAFSRVLAINPANVSAQLNRAIVRLRAGKLKDAREDYEKLRAAVPKAHVVYFGLGDIAYQRKDFDEALKNYELYLKYAPAEGVPQDERQKVEARVRELKAR